MRTRRRLCYGGSTLNLTDVRMTGNESSNSGGAIHVHGTLNLNRVLLDNNTASDGGALGFHGADGGLLTNVTISGNTATGDGGAIHTDSVIFITNSTIANNTGATVGGIFIAGGNVVLANSILDTNCANANASLTSGGYNIASDATASLTGSGDQVIDTLLFPFLKSMDNYGGWTIQHPRRSAAVPPRILLGCNRCAGLGSTRHRPRRLSRYRSVRRYHRQPHRSHQRHRCRRRSGRRECRHGNRSWDNGAGHGS